jgi:hypothetical protein
MVGHYGHHSHYGGLVQAMGPPIRPAIDRYCVLTSTELLIRLMLVFLRPAQRARRVKEPDHRIAFAGVRGPGAQKAVVIPMVDPLCVLNQFLNSPAK